MSRELRHTHDDDEEEGQAHRPAQAYLGEMISSTESERIAVTAARMASKETLSEAFSLLGIALGNQDSINEFRADLMFIRSIRKGSAKATTRFFMTMVTLFAGALAYGLVDWFRTWVRSGLPPAH